MKIPPGRMSNALAVITAILFILVWITGQTDFAAVVAGFVPARVGDPSVFADTGGVIGALPVWITPLSATLIHGGWLHLGFNLLMLLFCGRYVENVLGPRLLLLLYVIGAYAAAAAQWALAPDSIDPMIGASGAISALMGTYALLYSQQKVRAFGRVSANFVRIAWLAAAWIVIQLMLGLATADGGGLGRIAIGAHIGGFIAGLLLTRPMLHMRFRKKPVSVN